MTQRTESSRRHALGPGIILAAAAVGASHLVASTQAGALFGWQLWWVIVLVNVLKYPFFRFAVTYTLESKQNLIAGYYGEGKLYLWLFTVLNAIAAVVNTAGVLLLTASLLKLFIPELPLIALCWLILLGCLLVILGGQYRMLDNLSKWIMASLSLATVVAVIMAWGNAQPLPDDFVAPSPWQLSALAFLVAMMGWMPVPIELSAINSLWLQSKQKLTRISLKHGLFDFNLGYWVTAALAVVFLALGALVQFGSDQPIALAGTQFAQQFVSMYGNTIGAWSEYLVGGIAFLCMFGTTLAVLDGYARTLKECRSLLARRAQDNKPPATTERLTWWVIGQSFAGMLVIIYFQSALGPMLTFAMTLAFLTTPFFAWLNFKLARKNKMSTLMRLYGWLGLTYLIVFAMGYLYFLIFMGS
ncbi:NRAMP family divalent metal transporter [Pseudidiomarina andamanensis]|uniref:Divalent metal cation transporter n=1 Tax=Pseudidiomarina andamanensis TaxID=1940690 RepID=A0AA92ILR3_9GAMM|nr:divalent metal cation transporter [Pseudidiomarina andamanensis]MDS0219628.1 divalent metal cation transporter [Pseudidiomarina andamanensis]QGT95746.1 divalent metal cation transporter [Pseudidiomarina andamanensis]